MYSYVRGCRHHRHPSKKLLPAFFARFRHSFDARSMSNLKSNLQSLTNPNHISSCGKLNGRASVSDSIYNSNVRISNLGRLGKVDEARLLFDGMPHRDVVSYASMITVYLKNNDLSGAEKLFRTMPERSIVADSAMVNGYVKAGLLDEARKIFDHMPDRNAFSWTSLISGYFRSGCIQEAAKLFHQMPQKNVVSWTTTVLGYARNGLIDHARRTFDQMPEKNVVAWTAMLNSYVDNYQIDEACKLFHEMPLRNLYSWNIMIQGCLDDNRVNEAVQLFNKMPQRNAISWTTMVTGLARNGSNKLAREVFDQMPNKDVAAWNAMITAYADEGLMAEASELFNVMPERNIVTWNAMIDGYARNGPVDETFKHLILLHGCCLGPNETTLTSVLASCEGILQLLQAHALVVRLGFEHKTSLMNALVTAYSRSGDINSARLAFENLQLKDIVSWTAMILAYSYHGYGNQALQAFAQMLRSGVKPDEITFMGVLSACSHAGLVKKGQSLFNAMRQSYGLEQKAEHYSCLVDILGRAGQLDEAMKVVCEIRPGERDGAILGALLSACKLYGDVGLANHIGEELIELEPTKSGGYVLLANVYAACGKWDEFAQVRKRMKEGEVKKVPGYSQIDVKGKSHVFFAGDHSHPEIEEVYLLLQEMLLPLMQEIGSSGGKRSYSAIV